MRGSVPASKKLSSVAQNRTGPFPPPLAKSGFDVESCFEQSESGLCFKKGKEDKRITWLVPGLRGVRSGITALPITLHYGTRFW